jgi:wobble nucleotide-excising tRNase
MAKLSKPEYIAKAQLLSKAEKERLLSRMGGKLDRRLEKDKLSEVEAMAIQLELEDEQLQEWRKNMQILREKEKAKIAAKAKKEIKSKASEIKKTKKGAKVKSPEKSQAPSKAKVAKRDQAPLKAKAGEKIKSGPVK